MLNLCRIICLDYLQMCDSVNHRFQLNSEILITRLSFTHLRYIMAIDDPFERFFYELECIKGMSRSLLN